MAALDLVDGVTVPVCPLTWSVMANLSNQPEEDFIDRLRPESLAVLEGRPAKAGAPLNTPINLASNFHPGEQGPRPNDGSANGPNRIYSRADGTESWSAFEAAIGRLEGGQAISFASGMAAVSSVFSGLQPGSVVIVPDDCYHGVAQIVADGEQRLGWRAVRLKTADTGAWLNRMDSADLVWVESPSNPLLEIANVPTICEAAARAGVVCAVDNTFATPLLQRPLDHGATFSIHSATKFIGGHSDLLSGVVVSRDGEALESIRRRRTLGGATPGALESFLALRGLRTLAVRLDRSQQTALELAIRLRDHRVVTRVRYPGLPEHPGHDLASSTMNGPGSVLSFETLGSAVSADVRISRLRLITSATSLGGLETTIERRNRLPGQESIPATLMRLSVGIEHVEDLWDDLDRALEGVV